MICSWCYRETEERDACVHCERAPLLRNEWVLEASLGQGAAGHTWRARHIDDSRLVAIKELSFRRVADLKQIELFEREAELLRDLDHEGIPAYADHFVVEDDRHVSMYLVQEFIEGQTLDVSQRSSEDDVLALLGQVVDILRYLASRRPPVVHRDIKPSNIIRRPDGRYVLIDFGSTKAAVGSTLGETTAGTLGYMAPEQLRGQATPASDVYGLAATAVALLAGRDASAIVDPHNQGAWRDDMDLSPHLGDLLEEMLEVDLDWRLKDLDEVDWRIADVRQVEQRPRQRRQEIRQDAENQLTGPSRSESGDSRLVPVDATDGLAVEVARDPLRHAVLTLPLGIATGAMLFYAGGMIAQFLPAALVPTPAMWWLPAWLCVAYVGYFVLLAHGRKKLGRQQR